MKNLKLKAARAAMDLSQQELATRVGVSRQTINAIEKGDYNPTINLCIAICKELGKTLECRHQITGHEVFDNNQLTDPFRVSTLLHLFDILQATTFRIHGAEHLR